MFPYRLSLFPFMLWIILLSLYPSTSSSLLNSALSAKLRNFETLHHSDLIGFTKYRAKRGVSPEQDTKPRAIEKLTFTTSGREFTLLLTENRDLFGPNFKVTTVNDVGEEVDVAFNPHAFYKGVVQGESNSEVFFHWDSDEAINAKIVTREDTYYVEPSYSHLPTSDNYTMISYKASDRTITPHTHGGYCGGVRHGVDQPTTTHNYDINDDLKVSLNDSQKRRIKREETEINTCGLLVVVDTKFLNEIMGGDEARANNYVVNLIARVNSIYRSTEFGSFTGFGLQIDRIKIHDLYSSDPDHYNYGDRRLTISDDLPNPVNALLDAFGRMDKSAPTRYTDYCLAHLFTAYAFQDGVLGLAYIASPNRNTYGGVCSPSYYDSSLGTNVYLNTGWSSALNRNNKKILTQEAEIVLAHELGHNWGSEHDPSTAECSPADSAGGKHIMYTYAVNGYAANNKKFSPCSEASIGQVLTNKRSQCFKEMMSVTKGNFQRDEKEGEECDAGLAGDTCCTPDQKYTSIADCSVTNDVCCQKCSTSSARGNICATESDLTCIANSTCDGVHRNCTILYKEQGDYCQDKYGRCIKGSSKDNTTECVSFPDVIGITKCTCKEEDECKLCYKPDPTAADCIIFDQNKLGDFLKDGPPVKPYTIEQLGSGESYVLLVNSTCIGGYCASNGTCLRQSTDIVARFWDFITHLNDAAFIEFMESNIVGTVAVFSLILWLPCVIAVYCYDKKQAKIAKQEETFFRSMRRHYAEDGRMVNRPLMH